MENQSVQPIHVVRPPARVQLKGRQPEAAALREVRALIGEAPLEGHRRDLLIEHLHALNDAYHGLFERHLVALAAEMRLPMAEVFEVASFYHHFEILKDDADGARADRARVRRPELRAGRRATNCCSACPRCWGATTCA